MNQYTEAMLGVNIATSVMKTCLKIAKLQETQKAYRHEASALEASQSSLEYSLAYQTAYANENEQYWNDYYKNTGKRSKYPLRSGESYNLTSYYNAYYGLQSNKEQQSALEHKRKASLYGDTAGLLRGGSRPLARKRAIGGSRLYLFPPKGGKAGPQCYEERSRPSFVKTHLSELSLSRRGNEFVRMRIFAPRMSRTVDE